MIRSSLLLENLNDDDWAEESDILSKYFTNQLEVAFLGLWYQFCALKTP